MLHTENVARGQTESFQNVVGAKVYTMYKLFKSLGGTRAHLGGQIPPLNKTLVGVHYLELLLFRASVNRDSTV